MGKGRDIAQQVDPSPIHAQVLDDFMDQVFIVLLNRLKNADGVVSIPVKEVDATSGYIVSFNVVDGVFNFVVSKKS